MIRKLMRMLLILFCMYLTAKWPNLVINVCESGVKAIGFLVETIVERSRSEYARSDAVEKSV